MPMQFIGLRLPEDLADKVRKAASVQETTMSHIVRRTLSEKFTPKKGGRK